MRVAILKMQAKSQGGLEKYASRIADAFVQKGTDVTLLTNRFPQTRQAGVDPVAFPICRWPGFLRLEQYDRCIRNWLCKNPVDLVFGMERNRIQTHLRAGNGVHVAYLKSRIAAEGWIKHAICQLNPLHRKLLELEKEAFEHPGLKKIFVNSHMVRKELLSFYSVDPAKIEVIHNGVEWKEHEEPFQRWQAQKEETIARLGLDPEAFQLLFIGNGYRRKGLDPLLEALSRWKWKDWQLSVIGKEKCLGQYRAKAERLGLGGRVRFFGPQKEIVPFYQMADAAAIPSFYDPFANVTLEALSFGLFVISSKSNGGHEILTRENGALIEELSSSESIEACLDRALGCRKTKESAERVRSFASRFDFSIQLTQLIDACEI